MIKEQRMSTASEIMAQPLSPAEYKSSLKPVWCAGCGDYGVLNGVAQAFARLQIAPKDTMVISGIGCSSRIPGYLTSYGFNSVHGRALPIATGAKLANPKLNVVVASGDGDAFSIGIGHFPHACRRNVDMTLIVMDNNIYGLTKGQASPTSPYEAKTTTSRFGSIETPIDPIRLALGCETTFVARAFSGDVKHMVGILTEAIKHPGFSFVQIFSPCVTFVGKNQFIEIKQKLHYLEEDETHDPGSVESAFNVINEQDRISVGIIRQLDRPTYGDKLEKVHDMLSSHIHTERENMMDMFRP